MRDHTLVDRLPVEARILLLVAAPPGVADTDAELCALLASPALSWPRLLDLADRERAAGVLWRRIKPHAVERMGPQLAGEFERLAMLADFTAGYLADRVNITVAALQRQGIDPVLLKGAALAPTVYHSFFSRPMGDIDLLVPQERAEDAWRLVQKVGWRWQQDEHPLEHYLGHHHLPPLLDARGMNVRLELHTSLFVDGHPFRMGREELLAKALRVRLDGAEVEAWVPCGEHLLLHACTHFAWSHMMSFGSWRAFRDVMALADAGIDWDAFVELAAENRAESTCYWTLRLAERLTGAVLPAATMDRLEQRCEPRWPGVVERHVVSELYLEDRRCPSQWVRRRLWETAIRPVMAGHGEIRPWILDESLNEERPASIGGMHKAARQLARFRDWWRYARQLAG